ncbi:MAG: hypothetical protein NDJ90_02830 [Oligoflexia bacterium]|nr:hypothetical protein [Oligoflexia bacterium]
MNEATLYRRTVSLLSICFTLAVGCGAITNDYSSERLPGPKEVYDPRMTVGTSAQALLRQDLFRKVVVELQSVEGFEPTQEAINQLQRFLEKHLGRNPGQIEIHASGPIRASKADEPVTYTIDEVRRLERSHRRFHTRKGVIAIYFLFLDGRSADDHGDFQLLGQAHGNTSIVIYENTLREKVAKTPGTDRILSEVTVMTHELGHVLGLVNLNRESGRDHEDREGNSHCANPTCLMHSSTKVLLPRAGTAAPELDAACLDELHRLASDGVTQETDSAPSDPSADRHGR